MNVLWTKQKQHKTLSKTVTVHAHASGDGYSAPGRCCRLCGGDKNLHNFGDTYVWEGVEARYDQLLYDCFGVTVSSLDCLICGSCVRQLKSTEQFRALVHAAFDKSPSESTIKSKHLIELPKKPSTENSYVISELPKPIIQAQRTSHLFNRNRGVKRKGTLKQTPSLRRANVPCTICRQKYPAMVSKEGCEKFVCSRCKKKFIKTECGKCKVVIPANMKKHLELHVKDELLKNTRLRNERKAMQVRTENKPKATLLPKYKCSQCLKTFDIALNLINHMNVNHGDGLKYICAVCGKEIKSKLALHSHLKEHTGPLFQCANCLTVFRNNRALQTHSYKCKVS